MRSVNSEILGSDMEIRAPKQVLQHFYHKQMQHPQLAYN